MVYDIIGSIAIVKFEKETKKEKKQFAENLLKEIKNIKTVVEKIEKVSGRLRTIKTKFLAGKKTLETIHNESGCRFKLNIETCYFSPRLSGERLEVARMIKPGKKVLVLFAGVSPFSIVIAKLTGNKVVSVELGKDCYKYGKENVKLNKVNDKVEIIQSDVNKLKLKQKFDYIVMPRPQLKDTFLPAVLKMCRKNTIIIYYGFADTPEEVLAEINKGINNKRKIKILNIKRAGDIGPYRFRWRIIFKISKS